MMTWNTTMQNCPFSTLHHLSVNVLVPIVSPVSNQPQSEELLSTASINRFIV